MCMCACLCVSVALLEGEKRTKNDQKKGAPIERLVDAVRELSYAHTNEPSVVRREGSRVHADDEDLVAISGVLCDLTDPPLHVIPVLHGELIPRMVTIVGRLHGEGR